MEALIDRVKHEASKVDEAGRKRILDDLRNLVYSIELPDDTMQRIMLLVCISNAFPLPIREIIVSNDGGTLC